jgi:putative transposase
MKRSRQTEEQIIGILRENEAGPKPGELARKHGVSEGMIYAWEAKFGGMSVSEAQRLRTLEDENRRLKSLLADAMLDKAALSQLLSKMYGPPCSCKATVLSNGSSLRKCILPLASGLLLQPGHDEIRARRS